MSVKTPFSKPFDQFVPASQLDFTRYAKNLAWLLKIKHQAAQELLSRIYGYEHLHELQQKLKGSHADPGPYWDEHSPDPDDDPADVQFLLGGVSGERSLWPAAAMLAWRKENEVRSNETGYDFLIVELGLTDSPESHRHCVKRVKAYVEDREQSVDPWGFPTGFWALMATYRFEWRLGIDLSPIANVLERGWRQGDPIDPHQHFLRLVGEVAVDAIIKLTDPGLSLNDQIFWGSEDEPLQSSFWKEMRGFEAGTEWAFDCAVELFDFLREELDKADGGIDLEPWANFVACPSRARFSLCPNAQVSYERAVEMVSEWRAGYRLDAATQWREYNKPPLLFTGHTHKRDGDVWIHEDGEVQVLACPRSLSDEYGSALLVDLVATMLEPSSNGGTVATGCLQGWMFVPVDNRYYIDEHGLSDFLADHDIVAAGWNLAKRYMAIRGIAGMNEWVNSEEGCGVVVVKALMGSGYEANERLARMIELFSNAMASDDDSGHLTSEFAYREQNIPGEDMADPDVDEQLISSAGLITVSVPGARGHGFKYLPEDDLAEAQILVSSDDEAASGWGSRRNRRSFLGRMKAPAENQPSRLRLLLDAIKEPGVDVAVFDVDGQPPEAAADE